ncbi:MAG: ribosome small subunit-dependent GTPase A [Opitutaceae bacterium]|nr:ribosome small subunit-dependent GTPase A [Opitutaceae bacterium]
MNLSALGWNESFTAAFSPFSNAGLVPARVACEHKHAFELYSESGLVHAALTGKLLHEAQVRADLPAVGDWVAARLRPGEPSADIHAVLPRRTKFSRRAAGPRPDEQIVAANVDVVFLVTALDANYNVRRIERFLAVAWESGAQPVIVLNKSDLHPEPDRARREVEAIALAAPVVVVSALDHHCRDLFAPFLRIGQTLAFLGSSGVGKSTLINAILGEARQSTGEARISDSRGRHTTTRRELLLSESGVLVMDTPGMRELQFHDQGADVEETFQDILELAHACRFSDCSHRDEPGCAIQLALDEGRLDGERWASYLKLAREEAYATRKNDQAAARKERAVWKKINAGQRARRLWAQRNEVD